MAAGQYSGRRRRRYFVVGKPLLCCIVLVERCVEVWGLLFSVMFDAKFWMKKSVERGRQNDNNKMTGVRD